MYDHNRTPPATEDRVCNLYQGGMSLSEVSRVCGVAISTVRRIVSERGVLRTPADAIRLAVSCGKFKGRRTMLGTKRTPEQRAKISEARRRRPAKGYRLTSSGYIEWTCGPHAGRHAHRTVMEAQLGRTLRADEHVHHIDGDRTNNDPPNLMVVSRSDHARLHRLAEPPRHRDARGRLTKREVQDGQ